MTEIAIDPILEGFYNVRKRNPDFLEVFKDWAERSEQVRKTVRCELDLRYGESPKSTLDIFFPHNMNEGLDGKLPLHFFIHGGYWKALDKNDFSYIAEQFVREDVAVAIVNYDLCPDVDVAHILDQMRQALIWLWNNSDELGISPDNIHISGHSAGGQLASMLLATDWTRVSGGQIPNDVIKSCISISGLYDLLPLIQTSVNEGVNLTPETASLLSPLSHSVYSSCPVLATYGELEGEGFRDQALRAAKHWQSLGLVPKVMKINKASHFDAVNELAKEGSATLFWAVDQIYSQRNQF